MKPVSAVARHVPIRVCPLMVEQEESYDASTPVRPVRAPFVRYQLWRSLATAKSALRRGGRLDGYLFEVLIEDVRAAGAGSLLEVDFVDRPSDDQMERVVPALLSLAAHGASVTISCGSAGGQGAVVRLTTREVPELPLSTANGR
jgi:hypothetical protein